MKNLILFILPFVFVSCRSIQRERNIQEAATISQTEMLKARTIRIPPSVARLSVPLRNGYIEELPNMAVYQADSGRATVRLRILRDTLFVESRCDSLQQIIYEYERAQMLSGELTDVEQRKQTSTPVRHQLLFLVCVASLGYIAGRKWT